MTSTLLAPLGEPTSPTLPPALRRKLYYFVLPPLWFCYGMMIIDRSNLAVAQLSGPNGTAPHGMAQAVSVGGLGLSQEAFGLAAGIFFAGYALMQVPSNHLLLRLGARRVLGCCTLLSGLFSASTAFVRDESTLCLLRFLLGLGEAGFYPGAVLYVSTWFPDGEASTATAVFMSGAIAGSFVGNICSGAMMAALDGVAGLAGWRWLFLLQGAPTALLGLLLFLVLVDTPRHARWLTAEESDTLHKALERDGRVAAPPGALLVALRRVLLRPHTAVLAAQYFIGASGMCAYSALDSRNTRLRWRLVRCCAAAMRLC
jgi:MFS family permease